jgi:enamine deaminase RidA (YjgF/YER057c/UK114 family)
MTGRVAARLAELNITLPVAPKPVANYLPFQISGNQVHLCGHLPKAADGTFPTLGKVGGEVTIEAAREAAKLCVVNMMSTLALALGGDLDRITKFIKINVFVASTPDFTSQPKVADGASDLLVEMLGDHGRHARSAVGVAQLPLGVPVEIDAIVEFNPAPAAAAKPAAADVHQ